MSIHARLRLFGALRLTPGPVPQVAPVPLTTPDLQLLLAYMALHAGRPSERDRVAFRLWMEVPEAEALRNLRQSLHRLKRLLHDYDIPEVIVAEGRRLHFELSAGVWVDVHQFQAWVAANTHPHEAIDLYTDDLLPGTHADWLEPHRTRLREQFSRLLRTQVSAAMMRRNYQRALTYAERLINVGALRESSHRIYMEALYFNGKRATALRHYEWLHEELAAAFGVEPMAETQELATRIAAGSLPRDLPTASGQGYTLTAIADDIIGRREALQTIDAHFAQALNGRGSCVLITGTYGLGKTRLLDGWRQARAGGMLTLYAACEEMTFADIIAHAVIPWEVFPPQFPQLEAIRHGKRVATADAGRFLLSLAAHSEQVVTLALDDLHHADANLWALLAFVTHRAEHLPLFIIATANPEHLTAEQQRILRTLHSVETVTLKPLAPGEVTQLAGQSGAFSRQLYRLSEGNPFVATAYVEQGHLETPPDAVRAWVSTRFEGLPPPACQTMKAAAGLGRHVTFMTLQSSTDLSADVLLDGLDALLESGIMREFGDGYEFTHYQFYQAARSLYANR